MNSKLRLLVTEKCPNKCPLCCNKQFNMNDIPVVDRWNYDEVMITGGEPLAFPRKVRKLIRAIRHLNKISGVGCKIYVYTSIANSYEFKCMAMVQRYELMKYEPNKTKKNIRTILKPIIFN